VQAVTTPRTLDQIRAIKDPAEAGRAIKAYVERIDSKRSEALRFRDELIRRYLATHSISQTAAAFGVSVTTVKVAKR
jgi:hypothetical protein